MSRAFAIVVVCSFSACSGGGGGAPKPPPPPPPPEAMPCDGGDIAFVESASLMVLGRRPHGRAELNAWVAQLAGGRAELIRQLSQDPGYVERWEEVLMDQLRVQRSDLQTEISCYGKALRAPDGGALATWVRDHEPHAGGDGQGDFTALDLLRSSIQLDDLSPALRGNLFAMMRVPIRTCNLAAGAVAELSRRKDFGQWFDSAYLNRDMGCLRCHNSEFSVTWTDDPATNRHWPMPGHFEQALYGTSNMGDVPRAHTMFRFDGLVNCPPLDPCVNAHPEGSGHRPWDWSPDCGELFPDDLPPDPAQLEAQFGSVKGDAATVYDLERALARGVDTLATKGLAVGSDGAIADPDAALATLVAASVVEAVWREVIGTPLTIANHFPRNQAARDVLVKLTTHFVATRFSLRELLVDIALTPWFDPSPPSAGCDAAPYTLAGVYDPWTRGDEDPARRPNSSADGVQPLSTRTLVRATYAALGQTPSLAFFYPGGPFSPDLLTEEQKRDLAFLRGIGAFLNNGETGFRGLDFQARLLWEERFGGCANPTGQDDFVDGLIARAASTPDATLRDVIVALKDRIVGEPRIDEADERAPLEALFGAPLDTPAALVEDLPARTRRFCGVLLASPQFLLGGLPGGEAAEVPKLNP